MASSMPIKHNHSLTKRHLIWITIRSRIHWSYHSKRRWKTTWRVSKMTMRTADECSRWVWSRRSRVCTSRSCGPTAGRTRRAVRCRVRTCWPATTTTCSRSAARSPTWRCSRPSMASSPNTSTSTPPPRTPSPPNNNSHSLRKSPTETKITTTSTHTSPPLTNCIMRWRTSRSSKKCRRAVVGLMWRVSVRWRSTSSVCGRVTSFNARTPSRWSRSCPWRRSGASTKTTWC